MISSSCLLKLYIYYLSLYDNSNYLIIDVLLFNMKITNNNFWIINQSHFIILSKSENCDETYMWKKWSEKLSSIIKKNLTNFR